jgi:hypothetical protein
VGFSTCNKWIQEIVLKFLVQVELNMKRRRGTKMTPVQQALCFVVLISCVCILPAASQTVDLYYSSVDGALTDTTLESGKCKLCVKNNCSMCKLCKYTCPNFLTSC